MKFKLLFTLILGLSTILTTAFAQDLVFSRPAGNSAQDVSELILIEAYKKLGINVSSKADPGARALKFANDGKTDGEISRISGIDKKYPNLIQIPTKITYIEGFVYTKDNVFKVNGWDSLKPYKIGIVTGSRFVEKGTKGMNVYSVAAYDTAIKLLDKGRVDIVVMPKSAAIKTLKGLKITGLKELPTPVVVKKHYHYLNKKHTNLVPKITKILADMEASGRIAEIRKSYFDSL